MTIGLPSLGSSLGSLGTRSPQGDGGYDANGVMRVRGQRQRSGFSTGQPPAPQQTFAQLQASGIARPAPQPYHPPQQQFTGQLQGAVSDALRTPSRYDLPQVQQVRDALTSQLEQQFKAERTRLDEENARRGLLSSSIGAGYQGDLAGQHANALASMNAGLIQDAAANNAADRSSALGAGQNFQSATASQGLDAAKFGQSQYDSNADRALSAAQSAGNLSLGYGNLGINQQQANTQRDLGFGNLGLQNKQIDQSGSQFDQSLASNNQQFDIEQALREKLGLGGLDLSKQQVANQASQFGQTYNLEQEAQKAQQQQFKDSLAQQLGLATMGDRTANRGIDVQGQQANSDLILKLAQLLGLPTGTTGTTLGGGGTLPQHPAAPNPYPPSGGTGGGDTGGGDGSDASGKGGVVGGQQHNDITPEAIRALLNQMGYTS